LNQRRWRGRQILCGGTSAGGVDILLASYRSRDKMLA
jgi:hypothetical protein